MIEKNILDPGTDLFAKYRIQKFVGKGGWAYVYKAEHLSLHRPVAIAGSENER